MSDISTLIKGVGELNIRLEEDQIDAFEKYKDLLVEWNEIGRASCRERV